MKVTPRADYPVRVRPRAWEEDESIAPLYAGVHDLTLNSMVTITFVPELAAPPYERDALPADLDAIATPGEARLEAVLFADYAVTPSERLAGSEQRLPVPPWRDGPGGIVVYVTPEQFERLNADLESLVPELGSLHSEVPVSRLRGHPAVDFAADLVAAKVAERDRYWLREPD
jgi:hypothetical protein